LEPGIHLSICNRKPDHISFAKTTNIDKTDRFWYKIQKTNLNKIKQTKTITRLVFQFIDRFCRFIIRFSDLPISFVLQNDLSFDLSIDFIDLSVNFIDLSIFLKKNRFSLSKTGRPMKPSRTGFVENHEYRLVFVDK
jgi:hypothetical protein